MTRSVLGDSGGAPDAAALNGHGLNQAEVAERVAAGQVNTDLPEPGRTVAQILRANVCTRFNAILGTLFVVVLIVGPLQDALFGPVLVDPPHGPDAVRLGTPK